MELIISKPCLYAGSAATTGNYMVLRIFCRYDSLRTAPNMLIMNLAVSDFPLMVCLLPEAICNFFTGGAWKFGETACQIHAFTGIQLQSQCPIYCCILSNVHVKYCCWFIGMEYLVR